MAKDPAVHVERLEKAHLELQEKHAKLCDDISQMMEMLKILTKEKQTVETPNPQPETTSLRGTGGDTLIRKVMHYLVKPRQHTHHHLQLILSIMGFLRL